MFSLKYLKTKAFEKNYCPGKFYIYTHTHKTRSIIFADLVPIFKELQCTRPHTGYKVFVTDN